MSGPELIKGLNRQRILHTIHSSGPLARAEVADATGLTRPTVSALVAELLDEGWVTELGPGESSGGRRPVLLQFNPVARVAVGAELSAGHIRVVVCDLQGEVLARHKERITTADPALAMARVTAAVQDTVALAPAGVPVAGIGLGVTGLVDRGQGIWCGSPHFPGPPQPAAALLAAPTGLPVVVENDARCLALGEAQRSAVPIRSLVAVRVGVSIGAGIYLGGALYAGVDQGAGELGHTAVAAEGPRCACGRYGCLEAVAAAGAIAGAAVRQIRQGRPSAVVALAGGDPDRVLATHVIAAAWQGDALAREVLAGAGRAIGVAVGNLINLLNPERVVIGGGTSRAGEYLLGPLRETALDRALPVQGRRAQIVAATRGEEGVAVGAAALITAPLLAPPSFP